MLKRNPNYHGPRPHALDEIDYYLNVDPAQSVKEIEAGTADVTGASSTPAEAASLNARYGPHSAAARAGDQRYFTTPGARNHLAIPEHEPAAVQEREPPPGSQLRSQPPADRTDRRANVCPAQPADRPVPAAGNARLPRHPRLPEHPRPRTRQTTRPGPRRQSRLLRLRLPVRPSTRATRQGRARTDRDHRRAQILQQPVRGRGHARRPVRHRLRAATARTTPTHPTSSPSSSTAARSRPPTTSTRATSTTRPTTADSTPQPNSAAPNATAPTRHSTPTSPAPRHPPYPSSTEPSRNFFSARIAPNCRIHQPIYGVDLAALCLK